MQWLRYRLQNEHDILGALIRRRVVTLNDGVVGEA